MKPETHRPTPAPSRAGLVEGLRVFIALQLALSVGFIVLRSAGLLLLSQHHPLPGTLHQVMPMAVFDDLLFIGLVSSLVLVPFLALYVPENSRSSNIVTNATGRYREARQVCGALLRDNPFHHDGRVHHPEYPEATEFRTRSGK